MGLRETEGIVLKSTDYRDTSRNIRVQTPDFGRISLIAKGVRKPKSKFSGNLEELNYISIAFYYKEDKDLFLLSQSDLLNSYRYIKEDFNKLVIGLAISELVLRTEISRESNVPLFNLLLLVLKKLNEVKKNYLNMYIYFVITFLKINGYQIDFSKCLTCGKTETESRWYFSIKNGGIYCSSCHRNNLIINAGMQKYLSKFSLWKIDRIPNVSIVKQEIRGILNLLDKYMSYHIDGYKEPKSLEYLVKSYE
ncbi:DNA repair protein RecO [candidate division KSB1 bacterium]|nr:MAG: DNA repair protein RecO [candidate division KSB1 bacterium]